MNEIAIGEWLSPSQAAWVLQLERAEPGQFEPLAVRSWLRRWRHC